MAFVAVALVDNSRLNQVENRQDKFLVAAEFLGHEWTQPEEMLSPLRLL